MGLNRHNMRPNHLHVMIEAPGYNKLVTALYPEGDVYLGSDAVFGVKNSLVVVCHVHCSDDSSLRRHSLVFILAELRRDQ